MTKTHAFFLSSFILVFGVGFGLLLSGLVLAPGNVSAPDVNDFQAVGTHADASQFKVALLPALEERFDDSITGYNPQLMMFVYPGFLPEDFSGVAAAVGQYEFSEGNLWYVNRDSATQKNDSISDAGFETLFTNVETRLASKGISSMEDILAELSVAAIPTKTSETEVPPLSPDSPVVSDVCPQDAMMCPDGSSVGRTGPDCEFATCPSEQPSGTAITCTPEQREAEACIEIYAPVCGAVQVECVTTPCDPVPQTYPNSCFACAEDRVISYTEGQCAP
jgi:hypothetical protein